MADDIMEISSENGHHADEDLDFDFELTAPAGDEDAILEDADNTELGDNFHLQPSPSHGHDDPMIDEEDHDTFTMVDADLIHDGTEHNIEHETMSFASADPSHFDDINATTTYYEGGEAPTDSIDHGQQSSLIDYGASGSGFESVHGEHTQEIDHGQASSIIDYGVSGGRLESEHHAQENESNPENVEAADEDTEKVHPDENSGQPASPVNPYNLTGVEEPQSPPATVPDDDAATGVPTLADQPDQDHSASVASSDSHQEPQFTPVDVEGSSISTNEVIVLYQSNEYALFSTSELDDPDSYFLSDRSITQKPLGELLNAIRGIIREDLSNEDELCISFKDLNLETEEVSSVLGHVSLAHILALHEKLLANEGHEMSPLRIELGVRKSFLKRLEILTTGANEGKGISEFVTWSEDSGSVDGSEELHTGNNEVEAENNPALDNLFDDEGREGDAEDDLVTQSNIQQSDEQEQEEHYDVTEAPDASSISYDTKVSVLASALESQVQETTQSESNVSPKPEKLPSTEFDEDGDIIDYSEDEFDNTPAKSRGLGKSAAVNADTTRTDNVAGYAAFNAREDLRRRSGSRVTEEVPEQPTEHTTTETDGHAVEHEENGGDEDEYTDEYDEQADFDRDQNDFTATDEENAGVQNHPDSLHDPDGVGVEDDNLAEAHQELDLPETLDEVTGFAEYLGEETEEVGHEDMLNAIQQEFGGRDASLVENWDDQPIIETAGLVEPAESSGTISADEINFDEGQEEVFHDPTTNDEGQPLWDKTDSANPNGQTDEIDYEDEDENDEPEQEPTEVNAVTRPSQETSPTNGKRSRAEMDPDNALEKDAKRPRS